MVSKIDWFLKVVRIVGVNFPVAASFIQLQAEIDSAAISARIEKLEDPISYLHEDVQTVSKVIYLKLCSRDSININLETDEYVTFSRAIAALDSAGCLVKKKKLGSTIPFELSLNNPSFIMYLCMLFEEDYKMEEVLGLVNGCTVGEWLNGVDIGKSIGLPVCVVHSIFKIYEAKGYGFVSNSIGVSKYLGKA